MNEKTTKASMTSMGVAILRAVHQLVDHNPKVLEDPVIVKLLDTHITERIMEHPAVYQSLPAVKLRSHVLLRSRYAEDCLQRAYDRGIRQYLILGAGLDTFAYRQGNNTAALKIFEVDHPATQAQKISDLHKAGIDIPSNLRFVPIDFESSTLAIGLQKSDLDFHQPAFISWLGVTMYLTMDAIDGVFSFVTSLAPGTEIVFTFAQPQKEPSYFALQSAQAGEPWLSYFTIGELTEKLKSHGFSEISFLSPDEARSLYFARRTDGLDNIDKVNIARAIV